MHYCFPTVGSWEGASSFVRLREFGSEMLKRDQGIRVTYVVDDIPFNRERANLKVHPGANVVYTPDPRSFRQLASRRRALEGVGADVYHILNPLPKLYLAFKGARWARGKVIADWDMWQSRSPAPPIKKVLSLAADRWARRHARLCVVASRYLQDEFRKQFGIDAAYVPFAPYIEPHRADGQSPYDEPTAVYMGNIYDGVYDHDLLFHAAKLLAGRGKRPRMCFLGEGPQRARWQEWVRDNGLESNVNLPGFLVGDELWRHLRHAAVLLFPIRPTLQNLCRCPSKHLAYAQARRPIIANRLPEIEQVLRDQAVWVDTSPEAFADAIEAAVSSPGPDIVYDLSRQTWADRTDDLLTALRDRKVLT
jgi:glycosyltransferase involved in cell wall biosynthesis